MQQVNSFRRQVLSCIEYSSPIKRKVTLSTFDDCPVLHHTSVAHPTGDGAHLQLAFLPNDVPKVWQRSIFRNQHSRLFIPLRILDLRRLDYSVVEDRRIKYDLASTYPI